MTLFMGGLAVATELIKIQLHKFMRAGHKRHHWQVMLHWDGCGSVPLTCEMIRKKDAVKSYMRLKRIATHNDGKVCCKGSIFPALNAIKDLLQDSILACYGQEGLVEIL